MEQVLVVDSGVVENALKTRGLITRNVADFIDVILEKHYYCDRSFAENCDSVKQIIPYAILRKADEVYVLERLKKQTEKRLHGMLSIGVGGHINPDAGEADNPIEYGLYKELHEEVKIHSIDSVSVIGIINDLSTPVSNYHIGVLYEIWTNEDVSVNETEKMSGQWQSVGKLHMTAYNDMESWSKIALDYLCKA